MSVQCFLLTPTDMARVGLRRYSRAADTRSACPRPLKYHSAITYLGEVPVKWQATRPEGAGTYFRGRDNEVGVPDFTFPDPSSDLWPRACDCGYEFCDCGSASCHTDAYQEWVEALWEREDTGEKLTLRDAPDGAMWDAHWLSRKGPDGRCLVVKCPGGDEWIIDGRASNCTLKQDNTHRCWIRHGEPPQLTVDKVGLTCGAGAGSIQTRKYHGFLQNGVFT